MVEISTNTVSFPSLKERLCRIKRKGLEGRRGERNEPAGGISQGSNPSEGRRKGSFLLGGKGC